MATFLTTCSENMNDAVLMNFVFLESGVTGATFTQEGVTLSSDLW